MTILDALKKRGIVYRVGASDPAEITFEECPSCGRRWKFGLNLKTGQSNCFRCGTRSRKNGIRQVLYLLKIKDTVDQDPILSQAFDEVPVEDLRMPKDFAFCHDIEKADGAFYGAVRYLRKRGITREQMYAYAMGASIVGKYAYRVIIPVFFKSKLVGIEARDWTGGSKIKYLRNSGQKSMFNLPKAKDDGRLVIAEGAFKAIALSRIIPSTASFGHSITPLQMEQMRQRGWSRVLVFPDPDKPGLTGAVRAIESLTAAGFDARIVYPLPTKQADDYTLEELREVVRHSKPLTLQLQLKMSLEKL